MLVKLSKHDRFSRKRKTKFSFHAENEVLISYVTLVETSVPDPWRFDTNSDPVLFFSSFQDANKQVLLLITYRYRRNINTNTQRNKVIKKSHYFRNQGFLYRWEYPDLYK